VVNDAMHHFSGICYTMQCNMQISHRSVFFSSRPRSDARMSCRSSVEALQTQYGMVTSCAHTPIGKVIEGRPPRASNAMERSRLRGERRNAKESSTMPNLLYYLLGSSQAQGAAKTAMG